MTRSAAIVIAFGVSAGSRRCIGKNSVHLRFDVFHWTVRGLTAPDSPGSPAC